jgi:hypothetical protein
MFNLCLPKKWVRPLEGEKEREQQQKEVVRKKLGSTAQVLVDKFKPFFAPKNDEVVDLPLSPGEQIPATQRVDHPGSNHP